MESVSLGSNKIYGGRNLNIAGITLGADSLTTGDSKTATIRVDKAAPVLIEFEAAGDANDVDLRLWASRDSAVFGKTQLHLANKANAASTLPDYDHYIGVWAGLTDPPNLVIGCSVGTWGSLSVTADNHIYITPGGSMGIGGAPVAQAALEVTSTTQGILLPRMTEVQRDAIATPPAGLLIYNTTTNKLNFRAAAAWEAVTSA